MSVVMLVLVFVLGVSPFLGMKAYALDDIKVFWDKDCIKWREVPGATSYTLEMTYLDSETGIAGTAFRLSYFTSPQSINSRLSTEGNQIYYNQTLISAEGMVERQGGWITLSTKGSPIKLMSKYVSNDQYVLDIYADTGERSSRIYASGAQIINGEFSESANDEYILTVKNNYNPTAVTESFYKEGEKVYLTAETVAGYYFDHWEVESGNVDLEDEDYFKTSFIMPSKDVIISACYESLIKMYNVDVTNGTANMYGAKEGDIITIKFTGPESGPKQKSVQFERWEVVQGDIDLKDPYSKETTFVMPNENVSITGIYKEDLDNPFEDVHEDDDYYDAVLWAYYADPQITNGIDATHFGPERTVTRGQCVAFLWRAMGCPEPNTTYNPFKDVPLTQYYYKPVLWAVENGITLGTSATSFSPNTTLSTQHIVTFLYRMKNPGKDGWDGDAYYWASDNKGRPFGVDIDVNNKTPCPRGNVVQFLQKIQ